MRPLRYVLSALVLITALVTATAGAATKPARLLVAPGASALYWSYSMPLPGGHRYGTMKVTNPTIINKVRTMVNAIAVSNYPAGQICPATAMVPYIIAFSKGTQSAAYAKVVFQLGGCPAATVYQHGVAESPTLGSFNLSAVYGAIQKVISPKGQPLA